MRAILIISFFVMNLGAYSQTHKDWMGKINTIDEAKRYASKHSDVVVSFVNPEQDVFLFDDVNMSNLSSHVGETKDIFGRSTKFLVDTTISMSDVKIIRFDVSDIQYATMDKLIEEVEVSLSEGKTYWDVQKALKDTDAIFWSGPLRTDEIESTYDVKLENSSDGTIVPILTNGVKSGMIIVSKAPHNVSGFYSITYTSIMREK